MRSLILSLALLAAAPALAKPWQGIEPGVSKKEEVLKKFGVPSKSVPSGDKEILAYLEKEAIKGTTQVQFRVGAEGLVERIDVFPGPVVDKETVETSFGPSCASTPNAPACYAKKITDDFQTYFVYPKLGLAVFFKDDAKTVQSFVYQPVKAEGADTSTAKAKSGKSR
jgi:hypothetical protein